MKKKKKNRTEKMKNKIKIKKKLRSLEHYLCKPDTESRASEPVSLCRERRCVESAAVQRERLTKAEARESWSLTDA